MKAMILAAGRGTRMGRLTDATPKPLLPLAGIPLIEYHIRALAAAGFDDLVINVSWLGDQIVSTLGRGERFGVSLAYSTEYEGALETAGGIAQALTLLGDEPFVVVNADVWSDFPFHTLRDAPARRSDLAHLVMVPNPEHHRRGDFCFASHEPDAKETDSHQVPSSSVFTRGRLVEESTTDAEADRNRASAAPGASRFTYSGVGVYRPEAFLSIEGVAPLGPLLRSAIASNQISATVFRGHWWDVGTPERLGRVEAFLKG